MLLELDFNRHATYRIEEFVEGIAPFRLRATVASPWSAFIQRADVELLQRLQAGPVRRKQR